MSRKHNTRHTRSRSNYPKRLAKRGLSKAPRMTHYDAEKLERINNKEHA